MSLFQEIQAKCTPEQISSLNHKEIADIVSLGRTQLVPTEIGNGSILETLGIATANTLLDIINNTAIFKYVKPLLDQGRLRVDSTIVRDTLDSLVGNGISQADADALKALAIKPNPVTSLEVAAALEAGV